MIFPKERKWVNVMQRIVIASESAEQGTVLSGMLRSRYSVAVFTDGKSAIDHLRKEKAAVLVTDLLLAEADGLELVQTARKEQLTDALIVTGRSFSNYILACLEEQRVDYLVKSPYSATALAERIGELCTVAEERSEMKPESGCVVSGILLALGLRTKLDGFRYCRDGIRLLAEQPGLPMTKRVYPAVGKTWGVSGQAVEKSIRAVIASAWENRNEAVWRMYFPAMPNGRLSRPTNTEFLTRIADAVSMGKYASVGERNA